MEFFLKHIHERNLLKRWQEVKDLLPELIKVEVGYDYLETILYYTLTHIEEKDKIELKKMLRDSIKEEVGGELMVSIAETWFRDGMEHGRQEGIKVGEAKGEAKGEEKKAIEIARKMLAKGLDPKLVASMTGIDEEFIALNY